MSSVDINGCLYYSTVLYLWYNNEADAFVCLCVIFGENEMTVQVLMMNTGFSLFGSVHLFWIAVCILLTAFILHAKVSPRVIALSALLLHLLQCADRMLNGTYGMDTLPLHICSISTYLVFIHGFCFIGNPVEEHDPGRRLPESVSANAPCSRRRLSPREIIGEILFFPGLPGAFAAILFPNWTDAHPFSVLSLTGFLSHLAIGLYVLAAIRNGTLRPSLRHSYVPVLFLALYAAVMIPYDRHFLMNYGFLYGPSPGSPLVFIAEIFGYGAGYYIGYALLAALAMLLCYGLAAFARTFLKITL